MKKISNIVSVLAVLGMLFSAGTALAAQPVLSLSGSGDNVTLTVSNADPNFSIELNYIQSGSSLPTVISNFGYTNSSGYYSTGLGANAYGINSGATLYVRVNGQQSSQVTYSGGYCTYNCGSGFLSLSQTSLNVNVGQTSSVTAYNYYGGSLYVTSNSNPNAVSVSVSGSQINFYGSNSGTSTVNICSNNQGACASVYVTVGGMTGQITFSPSNPTLNVGQNMTVTVNVPYYGGNLYISGNSNPNVVTATVSGGTVNLYANQQGSSTITVCSGGCGSLYVTVSGGGNLNLSQSTVNLSVGQTSVVIASNVSNIYVSSNSNPAAVSAYITNSNQVTLHGLANGSANVNVCGGSASQCANIYVNVTGSSSSSLTFSQNNLNMPVGSNQTVYIYGGNSGAGAYYVSGQTNYNAVNASISGSNINLYAQNNGPTTITVCQYNASNCGTVYVNVGGSSGSGMVWFNISSLNLNVGQTQTVNTYSSQGNPNYYISSNSNTYAASAYMSGSNLIVSGLNGGSANINVCVSGGGCGNLNVNVNSGSVLGTSTYRSGQLINENGTIYMVYKNTKSGFVSRSVFENFGFRFNQVVNTGHSGLTESGYVIRNSAASHPWGSWIKSGQTVYSVHETGLIPVADYATFLNNGGQENLVVSANIHDFGLPMLSVMVWNDSRVR